MGVRTPEEQKAYLDGYERCAECIKQYLSDEGKERLEWLLTAVRNAAKSEDKDVTDDNIKEILACIIKHIRPDGSFSYFQHKEVEKMKKLLGE